MLDSVSEVSFPHIDHFFNLCNLLGQSLLNPPDDLFKNLLKYYFILYIGNADFQKSMGLNDRSILSICKSIVGCSCFFPSCRFTKWFFVFDTQLSVRYHICNRPSSNSFVALIVYWTFGPVFLPRSFLFLCIFDQIKIVNFS